MNNAPSNAPLENEDADKRLRIRALNDNLRTTFSGGTVVMTNGLESLGTSAIGEIARKVQTFDTFTLDNDPYGEHDFGEVLHNGQRVFWKIDTYDQTLTFCSDDPSDPEKTVRVLTVMLAEEY